MSNKQTYTFYFELFGQKKKWSTDAGNPLDARKALDQFVCSQISVVKTDGAPAAAHGKTGDKFQDMFGDIFSGDSLFNLFK